MGKMNKKDFATCKRWLRRHFPVNAKVRVLCVSQNTLKKHQKSGCTGNDKNGDLWGLCTHDVGEDKITPIKFIVYVDNTASDRMKVCTLLHEYSHTIRDSMPDHFEYNTHDGVWKSIHNRLLKLWAEA